MRLEDLGPEFIEKAKACKTATELAKLILEEGVELSEKQLEKVTGGINWGDDTVAAICPHCGYNSRVSVDDVDPAGLTTTCTACGTEFALLD